LIIHDKEDREAPYHYAERIKGVWPNAKLITTEGLGHNLKSQDVVKMVTGFLEQKQELVNKGCPLVNVN
jgi:tagatose-1,6-bisphosphate aldolase non-catalytic subunit AgaZ/GatZ